MFEVPIAIGIEEFKGFEMFEVPIAIGIEEFEGFEMFEVPISGLKGLKSLTLRI